MFGIIRLLIYPILLAGLVAVTGCQPMLQPGCTDINRNPLGFDVENLNGRIQNGLYEQKIENLIVVVDDTTTMNRCIDGYLNRDRASNLLSRIVKTIPTIELNKAIRIYGPYADEKQNSVSLTHGRALSPRSTLEDIIITKTVSDTVYNPLADALEGAYHELKLVEGGAAVILISDFKDPKREMLQAAQYIRDYYKGNVCLYPIVIGDDGPGRNSAEDVVERGGCGISALATALQSGESLADFMEKVLFDKLAPAEPQFPIVSAAKKELSYEKLLKERKISIELKTEFDFDKSNIRQEYSDHLQKIADFMRKYPNTFTTIEGHTCSIGTEQYNLALSTRRAKSVQRHLVGLGVEPERMQIASFGETRPIADNSTSDGRKKNRRAVAVITTTVQEYIEQSK